MSGAGQSKHAILWAVIIPVEVSACILRDTRSKDGVEEDGAYLDIDLVEFHDEDFRDITTILKLGDTTKDKLTFTVSFWGDISFVILHLEMAGIWCSGTGLKSQSHPSALALNTISSLAEEASCL